MLSARLHGAGIADAAPRRVVNLSETGICLATGCQLAVGEEVAVSIGEVDYAPAQVMWARDGVAGLRFLRPIDVGAARRRRAAAPAASAAAPSSGWMANMPDAYRSRSLGAVSIGRRFPGR